MRKLGFRSIRMLAAGLAGVLMLAAPARAELITLNFTGEVDLTPEGGAVYQYSGFFSWDPASAPHDAEPGLLAYALADYQLIFDGVDVTFPPSPDGNGNGLAVVNDFDIFGTGDVDAFIFYAGIGRPFDPGGDMFLFVNLAGPTTMFSSLDLPADLQFLQSATAFSSFYVEPDDPNEGEHTLDTLGSVEIRSVPEPASLSLIIAGAGAALARARRQRRQL